MKKTGTLLGIAQRSKKRAPMEVLSSAEITFVQGVQNDSRGKNRNKRQVTVLTSEAWLEACADLNASLPWTFRRANLLIGGLPLEQTTGKKLRIGTVLLEITGELEPCQRMDEQFLGLTHALEKNWRGGVTCKLLSEGTIRVEDPIELID